MKNNELKIVVKNNQVSVRHAYPMQFTDFISLVSTAILSAMNQVAAGTPEEQRQNTKEELYDMYNAAASNTLHYFAPEIDMRPHLTTQAILEKENEIIERMAKEAQEQDTTGLPI